MLINQPRPEWFRIKPEPRRVIINVYERPDGSLKFTDAERIYYPPEAWKGSVEWVEGQNDE